MGCLTDDSDYYKYEKTVIPPREIGEGGFGKTFLQVLKLTTDKDEIIKYFVFKEIKFGGEKSLII